MLRASKRRRAVVALLAASAVFALAGVLATSARADQPTREDLVARGWTCVEFLPANRWSCFNPGTGRPFPGNPDPRPTYNFLAFDRTSGDFIYTGHLIREDLYSGQPCAPGDDPYVFRLAIRYYECVHA